MQPSTLDSKDFMGDDGSPKDPAQIMGSVFRYLHSGDDRANKETWAEGTLEALKEFLAASPNVIEKTTPKARPNERPAPSPFLRMRWLLEGFLEEELPEMPVAFDREYQ